MKELAELALNDAQVAGAGYADVRINHHVQQNLSVKNGELAAVSDDENEGVGVRLLLDGAWGFASSSRVERDEIEEVVRRALRIARASARVQSERIELGEPVRSTGNYRTAIARDPFSVPLSEKVELLFKADAAMASVKGITVREGSMEFIRERKLFASTEGAYVEQEFYESGGAIEATASSADDVQNRSYPNSFGRDQAQAGYEFVESLRLPDHGARIAEQAIALLSAPQCSSGTKTLILDASQVALQIHESCGHPTELDRVFGMEAAYAGTSFMTTDKLGKLRYGSEQVTITADALSPGGLGTFAWDDEGVPAQRSYLVEQGLFVGYLTSRETAVRLGQRSNGTMRADGWNRIPLIRMTNVNLEPGASSLEEMIADTRDGLYMETNRSWSIDDKRLNFQFGTQLGYEIVNGKRARLVKNPTYAGSTPVFWNSCDAVGGAAEWRLWGLTNCGKGQPPQAAHVAHGAAPARFQNVTVGILK